MRRIYLDHAATSPLRPEARAAMLASLEAFGNPSSLHEHGRLNRQVIDHARDTLSEALGCVASEIIFTSGGTEADNLALFGAARSQHSRRHILVSAIEHHAVLHSAEALVSDGFELELIPVDPQGRVHAATMRAMLRPDTALVSVMTANNELGTIQPVPEIAAMCRANGTLIHTDAVQAFGHLRFSAEDLGIDLLSISAHKFGGPPGVGALYVREGVSLRPTLFGGAQERGRRGGTENAAAIAGMDAAISAWKPCLDEELERERRLTDALRRGVGLISGTWINTPAENTLPGVLNVGFDGLRAESLLLALDLEGVAASSGSACASGSMEPSHVLRAIGLSPDRADSCIRFSVGWTSTLEEIDHAIKVGAAVVERARRAARRPHCGGDGAG